MGEADSLVRLGIALDGAGWHPAAWREPAARPRELLTGQYWADLVRRAEDGLADFVTFEDSLSLQSAFGDRQDERTDQVRGRLDAVLIAARVAPLTAGIGLIPAVVAAHTEPFHASKAIATLDYVSGGRAGLRVRPSDRPDEAGHFGRREPDDQYAEMADYVEVVRRLWDSWEDDAEIRDVATGRFVDRGKLHYIDFEGRWFNVKGPSITPRPPQGQPPVAAVGHGSPAYQLIGRSADIGFITPGDLRAAAGAVAEIRAAQAGRDGTVHVFADLLVYLDDGPGAAAARRDRLDERAGYAYTSPALTFTGSSAELADLMQDWMSAGLSGFRLRPAAIPDDLVSITERLVPELRRRGVFRSSYSSGSLRGLLGLSRPASRYAAVLARAI
jgi:alkanesulfonate monooxygenase SsuD/methylene tetrahydromethanopterin reductase-like flavin-dependent oxidoreductase (luciferase family)